jgi:hypothetical protein
MLLMLISLMFGYQANEIDYTKTLQKYKNIQERLFDPVKVNEIQIKNIKTDKIGKIGDLTDLEKDVFIVLFAQELSAQTTKLHTVLQKQIKEKPSSEQKIKVFYDELQIMRTSFAKEFEDFVCKMIDRHKDEMTESESKNLISRVRGFHDKQSLIKRNRK